MGVAVEILLLGDVQILVGGRKVDIGPSRRQAVLAALAVDAPHPVSADTIIDRVWGEHPPESARATVFSHISRIRRLLHGDGAVERATAGYALRLPPGVVDVDRFRQLVRDADGHRATARRAESLALALGLWRGPPLAGIPGAWAAEFREHWRQRRLTVALQWAEVALASGHVQSVLDALPKLAAEFPLVEPLEAMVLRALRADGRVVQALDRYAKVRHRLVEELGVEPGADLRAVHGELLRDTAGTPAASSTRAAGTPAASSTRAAGTPAPSSARAAGTPAPSSTRAVVSRTNADAARAHTREWAPFIGRVDEIAAAAAAWACARDGDGPVLAVRGEAGVGKTRFADEVARVVGHDGARVLWGACRESYTVAFQPVVEALSVPSIVSSLEGLSESTRDCLGWIVPSLGRAAPTTSWDDVGMERNRSALFAAVADALSALAAPGGLLLVVEDLHWATTPTLQLVDYLTSTAGLSRVLVMATFREPSPSSPELSLLVSRVGRLPGARSVHLDGFSLAEIDQLTGVLALDRDAERLLRDTGGNALLLGEVLRARATSGSPAPADRDAGSTTGPDVPRGVRDHVRDRMAGLPAPVREAVAWVAVIGDDVELPLLAAVMRTPEAQALRLLEAATASGILRETGPNVFAFVHALTRRALLDGRTSTRLAMQRAHVANVIEERPGLVPHGRQARVASYRLAQVTPGAERTAAGSALIAARNALAQLAYEDAITLAVAGRAALATTVTGSDDLAVLAELWLVEAQAADPLSRHRQRLAAVRAAATLARQTRDPVALARAAALGLARWTQGKLDLEMVELAQEALDALGHRHSALRAQLTASLAGAVSIAGASAAAWLGSSPHALASQALSLARASGDDASVVRSLVVRLVTLFGQPDLGEQLRLADELVGLNEGLGLRWRTHLRLTAGDRPGFEADLQRLASLATRRHDNELQAYALQCRAMVALADCEFDRAAQIAMQANVVGQGHPDFMNVHLLQVFWVHVERGDLESFADIARGASQANPGLPGLRGVLAFTYARMGRPDLARAIVADLARDRFAAVPRDIAWPVVIAGFAETAALLGDVDAATTAGDLLAPYSGQLIVAAGGAFCFAAADRVLGVAAALRGDHDAAAKHFDDAVAVESGVSEALVLRTLWWRWHLLGPPGPEELTAALTRATRHGLVDISRRLAALPASTMTRRS